MYYSIQPVWQNIFLKDGECSGILPGEVYTVGVNLEDDLDWCFRRLGGDLSLPGEKVPPGGGGGGGGPDWN